MKALNEALSFLLELAMLLALGYVGFHIGGPAWLKWLVGIGLPLAVAVFWGLWMAPRADHRLPWPVLPIVALALFLVSAALLYMAGAKSWAIVMAAASMVNAVFVMIWHQY